MCVCVCVCVIHNKQSIPVHNSVTTMNSERQSFTESKHMHTRPDYMYTCTMYMYVTVDVGVSQPTCPKAPVPSSFPLLHLTGALTGVVYKNNTIMNNINKSNDNNQHKHNMMRRTQNMRAVR